ncbi:NitT/TauT family transport system substrate-binding protein [Krasilnikovia cinnamomea]|uniref:NitT/TauT family transport system substrate-binding protein n=1 Tax=Krasilnikovia cinnamomea TaxID=349313 RepID=A0A4Q7ZQP0_9ACTN|nr:ABC transporter substrate-binding protein [Krasilnikovia cinnamomea]RZU52699.1 NitT/TauT family transport system substrate-binding protein [Krasilnikovia cinnamomea]
MSRPQITQKGADMTIKGTSAAFAATAALLVTTACDASGHADPSASGATLTVKIGAVPTIQYGVIKLAQARGFFAEQGVRVDITNVDSGPNVVTGVVAGQYDVGWTAYAPVLLAVAAGNSGLKKVANVSLLGAKGTNSGLLVRKDSGITSFAALAGKKVATNAQRSLVTLTTQAAVAKAGGDPSTTEFVALPLGQIAKAVAERQVDAGVTAPPYQSQALKQFPELADLGDTLAEVLPPGSPTGLVFGKKDLSGDRKTAMERFQTAIKKALAYADDHQAEVKAAGAPLAGLSAEEAAALPDVTYRSEVTAAQLAPLVALMKQFGWVKNDIDLAAFVGA